MVFLPVEEWLKVTTSTGTQDGHGGRLFRWKPIVHDSRITLVPSVMSSRFCTLYIQYIKSSVKAVSDSLWKEQEKQSRRELIEWLLEEIPWNNIPTVLFLTGTVEHALAIEAALREQDERNNQRQRHDPLTDVVQILGSITRRIFPIFSSAEEEGYLPVGLRLYKHAVMNMWFAIEQGEYDENDSSMFVAPLNMVSNDLNLKVALYNDPFLHLRSEVSSFFDEGLDAVMISERAFDSLHSHRANPCLITRDFEMLDNVTNNLHPRSTFFIKTLLGYGDKLVNVVSSAMCLQDENLDLLVSTTNFMANCGIFHLLKTLEFRTYDDLQASLRIMDADDLFGIITGSDANKTTVFITIHSFMEYADYREVPTLIQMLLETEHKSTIMASNIVDYPLRIIKTMNCYSPKTKKGKAMAYSVLKKALELLHSVLSRRLFTDYKRIRRHVRKAKRKFPQSTTIGSLGDSLCALVAQKEALCPPKNSIEEYIQ